MQNLVHRLIETILSMCVCACTCTRIHTQTHTQTHTDTWADTQTHTHGMQAIAMRCHAWALGSVVVSTTQPQSRLAHLHLPWTPQYVLQELMSSTHIEAFWVKHGLRALKHFAESIAGCVLWSIPGQDLIHKRLKRSLSFMGQCKTRAYLWGKPLFRRDKKT